MTGTRHNVRWQSLVLLAAMLTLLMYVAAFRGFSAPVQHEDDKAFLVDRTGERWDITQAVSLGFRPEGFQYGLGRHAFRPLDDSLLRQPTADVRGNLRVLGIQDGTEVHAYSVPRLGSHEIANSRIAGKPIAVAY